MNTWKVGSASHCGSPLPLQYHCLSPDLCCYLWPVHGKQPLTSAGQRLKAITEWKGIKQQFSAGGEIVLLRVLVGNAQGQFWRQQLGRSCYKHLGVQARGASKRRTMHRTVLTTKHYPAPNVNGTTFTEPGLQTQ